MEPALEEAPFFYSTDVQLPFGQNDFVVVPAPTNPAPEAVSAALNEKVKFLKEYDVRAVSLVGANIDGVIYLKKKQVSLDDVGLPNEMLFWFKEAHVGEMLEEKVRKDGKSGHLKVVGSLDFDQDGRLDLIIQGDQNSCVYRALFKGLENGLQLEETPLVPCSCS